MKLHGILSSKSRREIHERNRDLTAPAAHTGALDPAEHAPSDGPDGTLICSCSAGSRYSPAAFAVHLAGGHMVDAQGAVYITRGDPWLDRQRQDELRDEGPDAATRAAQVEAYYAEQAARRGSGGGLNDEGWFR